MLVSGDRSLSQRNLQDRASRAAAAFREAGLGRDDVVALLLRNDLAMFEASAASAVIGGFSVPINWHFGAEEVAYILTDSGAKLLVVHADLLVGIAHAVPAHVQVAVVATPPEIAAAYGVDPAAAGVAPGQRNWDAWLAACPAGAQEDASAASRTIVYTSGTTGKPKGVRRDASPEAAERASQAIAELFDLRPDARTAITGPMYHSALNAYGLRMALVGAEVRLMPRFDARTLLEMIQQHRLTHLHLVPIMFTRLLKLPEEVRLSYDVSSLRHVVHGAAPCPPEVKRRMIQWWGPIIHEYFGSTETRQIAACDSAEWLAHPGTVGRVLPQTEIVIVGDDGAALAAGEVGEIYARNHAAEDFAYTGDPSQRAKVDRDGLVTSGDVGYLDADGFLFLCDRRRDMINSGGVNIYPAEIEACLLGMPGVQDCAVFGVPDEEFGEGVAAAVQPEPGASLDAEGVRAFVRERLARFKAPRHVEIRDELPRDDSGKIFKKRLRDPYWQGSGRRI